MGKHLRKLLACVLLLAVVMSMIPTVQAQTNYNSYTYDEWDESQKAPAGYAPVLVKNGMQIGTGNWKTPSDLFIDDDGLIYVADTGNARILVLNTDLELQRIMETVTMNGEEIPLEDVQGLYVSDDGVIYACQSSLSRILLIKDDQVIGTIDRPVSNLIADDFKFAPTKVGVDIYGRAFVLSKGCYSGLLQYDVDGSFMGFFGANKVEVTADVLFSYLWKSILSDEQRAAMTSILPIEYSNVDCNEDGFVYTSTVGTQLPKSQVKKLNPLGNNVYFAVGNEEFNFGDEEITYNKTTPNYPSFIDVKVDEDGFIFAIDLTTSRIFVRDQEANLISVFGGYGQQTGTFNTPVAVDCWGDRVYVLDRLKNNITVFEPTEYGALVRQAVLAYDKGLYSEAEGLWKQVLERNANCTLAYNGIGKALAQENRYEEAMQYLRRSGDRYSYSRSFGKNRLELVRAYGVYAIGAVVVLAVVSTVLKKWKRKE